ncbi:MAG TPA: glycosyltransferase family 39 protein [Anaeromyxobacter sp.]|nr:glycosyltransferase family 39 protein [Anaeromyxobacter sp.]
MPILPGVNAPSSPASPRWPAERLAPALLALLAFALHAACWGRYGIFRDELYFLSCGRRLAAGYVDQPAGIAVVARIAGALFGTWVPGLRLPAWLAAAAAVWLCGRLAARLGGGGLGAAIAAGAALTAPVLLALGHLLTMNVFEQLLLLALATLLVRLAQGEDERLWVAAGGVAGLAVLFKYTAAVLALALLAGLVATPARRAFRSRWVLAGAATGLLVVLPNFAWQAAHGFPFLEIVRSAVGYKNTPFTLGGFSKELLLDANPLLAPLWLGGLAWLLAAPAARPFRFLGLGAALTLAALIAGHGKSYYFAGTLPLLFAAGGAALGRLLGGQPASGPGRVLRVALPALLLLVALVPAPLALPLLSVETFVRYQAALGQKPRAFERMRYGRLPQLYADQHGWRELAEGVAIVAATLRPEEKPRAVVFGHNYGEAAAVDVYGPELGLPPAISGHNSFWLWGVPPGRGDPAIVISDEREDCGHAFREAIPARRLPSSPWVMPYEDARWIWICREATRPLAEAWPRLRHFE